MANDYTEARASADESGVGRDAEDAGRKTRSERLPVQPKATGTGGASPSSSWATTAAATSTGEDPFALHLDGGSPLAEAGKAKALESSSSPKVKISMAQVEPGGGSHDPLVAKQKETLSRMQPAGPNATAIHGGAWGVCDTETVAPTLKLKNDGTDWKVDTVDFLGNYSKIVTLVAGVKEVGGPGTDTTKENYKKQMGDLRFIADDYKGTRPPGKSEWYMLKAVADHESVHESRLLPALTAVAATLAGKFTPLKTPSKDVDEPKALQTIKGKGEYATAVSELRDIWDAKYVQLIGGDHAVLTPAAEHAVVDPMIAKIERWAKTEGPEKSLGNQLGYAVSDVIDAVGSAISSVGSFLGFKEAKHKDDGDSAPTATVSMARVEPSSAVADPAVAKQKETLSRMQPAGPNATSIHSGWGVCDTETVDPTLKLKNDGTNWVVDAVDFHGNYSKIVTLVAGVKEVGGPGVDTTATNYKKQMADLKFIADDYKGTGPGTPDEWYMWQAVDDHEAVHESRLLPALTQVAATLASKFTPLKVPVKDTDENAARSAIKGKGEYATAVAQLRDVWDAKYVQLIGGDHAVLAPAAEHKVVDPMMAKIDTWAKTEGPDKPPEVKKTTTDGAPQGGITGGPTAPTTGGATVPTQSDTGSTPTEVKKPQRGGAASPKNKADVEDDAPGKARP